MSEVLVVASALSKTFGEGTVSVTAIREATFELRAGDRVALAGPSGSGKSTILHLIAALEQPTTGSIEWPGLGPASALRPGLVSMAFQGPSLMPPLTVLENVALPLLLAGADEAGALAEAGRMLDRLELGALAGKLPEELSGGQSQRASVARALVGHARLVLADEPTGQQDHASGQRVIEVLLDQATALDVALVVATHDATVASRFPIRWSLDDRRLDTGAILRSR